MMEQGKSQSLPWSIVVTVILLGFAMYLPMYCVPPMEHILKEELQLTHAQTSLLYSIPIMMVGAVALPAGLIADRIGVKKAAGVGAILLAVGSTLRGTATTPSSLLAFTSIYGIGLGWVWPNLPKLVSIWFPRDKASVVTGMYSVGIYVGAALAMAITIPVIFPIANTFQGTFFIWGILPIVTAILWWVMVRELPHTSRRIEPTTKGYTVLRQVIRNKNFWLLSIFFLLNTFFLYTWTGWAPALLMIKGATPELAGVIASIAVWAGIPAVFIIPRLSYKLGLRKPFLWVSSTVLAITAGATIHTNLSLSWLPMALVGFADCTLLMTTMVLPIDMMSEKEMGTSTGLLLAIGHAGGLIGPWIGGRILDQTGNLDLLLLVLMGIAIASAGIAFRLPETGPKAKPIK